MSKKRKAPAKSNKPDKSASRRVRVKGAKNPAARRPTPASRPGGSASKAEPGDNARSGPATFEEAKSAAIDALIRVIEESERRLSAVKRAATYDELNKLTSDPAA